MSYKLDSLKIDRCCTAKARLAFVDAMRGLGITAVVLGHITRNGPVYMFLYAFHMPLFFIISGFLFKKRSGKRLLRSRISTLVFSYFLFSTVTFIYWWAVERNLRGGSCGAGEAFLTIFRASGGPEYWPYNSALWFLPCLFLTEIVYQIAYNALARFFDQAAIEIGEFVKRFMLLAICIAAGIFWIPFVSNGLQHRLPWMADVVPVAAIFYALGALISARSGCVIRISAFLERNKIIGAAIAFVGFACLFIIVQALNVSVNFMELVFPNMTLMMISALLGVSATFVLSCTLSNIRSFHIIGRDSLNIMGLHEPIKRIVIIVGTAALGIGVGQARNDLSISIMLTAGTLLLSWLAGRVLNCFLIKNRRRLARCHSRYNSAYRD